MSSMNLQPLPSALMMCWLTDLFSNPVSRLDSVSGLRNVAATAAVVHYFFFFIPPFYLWSALILSSPWWSPKCRLIVSKQQIDHRLLDSINTHTQKSCFIYELFGCCFYFLFQEPQANFASDCTSELWIALLFFLFSVFLEQSKVHLLLTNHNFLKSLLRNDVLEQGDPAEVCPAGRGMTAQYFVRWSFA